MALGTPSWLNVDFTERILRLAEEDNTVRVIDIFVKPATSKGDNYASDMMRVVVEFTRKQGDKKVNEKKSLLFKFEPINEGPRKEMIESTGIFDTEIAMFTDTLKKMNDMMGHECRFSARAYHVRMERPLCLILEDLAPLGFRMANRQVGFDLAHSILAMQRLAKFHACSVALCEKEPKQKHIYKGGIFYSNPSGDITSFFEGSCLALAAEIETWPELGKSCADKLVAFAKRVYEVGKKAVKPRSNEFNVINHGDYWVNNMLFRYDNNSKPIDHIFVDFQLSVYASPTIDLQYFLSTSVLEEVSENSIDGLLDEYLRTLSDTMKQLNCKTAPPSMEQLQKSMEDRLEFAMLISLNVLPFMMTDKSQVKEIDELINQERKYDHPGFKNPLYRKVIYKRLSKYMKMGLLDPHD